MAQAKAAGAGNKERTLRSYVLGHYKSERHELSGAAKAVFTAPVCAFPDTSDI